MTLKRDIPRDESVPCPPNGDSPLPGEEERVEARRLMANADQALILGDQARARDLLARGVELDPTSPELAYRHARVLEEIGARDDALYEYCRVVALGTPGEEIADAETRIRRLRESEGVRISTDAIDHFRRGLEEADADQLDSALGSFSRAWELAPDWADAIFNRGLVRARLGRTEAAVEDLERYLSTAPEADDAILVSQRIGQLQSLANLPNPGTALTLGVVFPGAGQFYSGRAGGGVTVLALAAGAVAGGFLIKEVTVSCVGTVDGGAVCPPDRVIGEEVNRPYAVHGLIAAGAIAVAGAVESFFRARDRRTLELGALVDLGRGEARIATPTLRANGTRLDLSLVRVNF